MSYRAEYPINGTASTTIVTETTCTSRCATHGELVTVNNSEYAAPGAHVERVARLHHADQH